MVLKNGSMINPENVRQFSSNRTSFRAEFNPENNLKTPVEGIIRLVVHDQFVVHKVETV